MSRGLHGHRSAKRGAFPEFLLVALLAAAGASCMLPATGSDDEPREASTADADDSNGADDVTDTEDADSTEDIERNLTMKTLGGRQFWGDITFFQGWRIQHNVLTGHYRLLDDKDYRHESGTLQECRDKLDEVKRTYNLQPMKGKAAIVIHGIVRSSKSMSKIRARLEKDGYTVVSFDYPSTRVPITESAEYLHKVIESLEGIEQIDFVVHSMGGLVVRAYLHKHHDKRIGRMVMMGVPNLGAEMADKFQKNLIFRAVLGPAGQQLVTDADGLIATLPVPDFEFGVIAGSRGTESGYNPLIPGDDDGTVRLESTRLAGAADFITVRSLHSMMMRNAEAIECSARFLKEGHFRESGQPEPIPRPAAQQDPAKSPAP